MVDPPSKRIELYLKGLASEIQSHATSANLDNIQDIQRLAHRLTDRAVEQNRLPSCISAITTATTSATPATPSDNKRKWDGYSSRGSATVQTQAQQQRKNSDHQSRISQLLVVRGRVDIGEFTQCVTNATDTTMVSATRDVARGVSRWAMKLRIQEPTACKSESPAATASRNPMRRKDCSHSSFWSRTSRSSKRQGWCCGWHHLFLEGSEMFAEGPHRNFGSRH
ncbi:hypothetical protein Hanom_Chr01g00044581 [Helianthus anomalus]